MLHDKEKALHMLHRAGVLKLSVDRDPFNLISISSALILYKANYEKEYKSILIIHCCHKIVALFWQ